MKRRCLWSRTAALLCACLLLILLALPTFANSAQTHWRGTDASGAVVVDGACPLVVEHELLTFDLQTFPVEFAQKEDAAAYNATVTAAYTFYNPSDYAVTAALVFPFGMAPDYYYDIKDTDKYDVTVNGSPIPKTLRHTLSDGSFDLQTDLALLQDGFASDAFYRPEMTVTRYLFTAKEVDTENYTAATAAFLVSADAAKTRVLFEDISGGSTLDHGVLLQCWVEPGEIITLDVIGEPLAQLPDWKFYENGACKKEIPGRMQLVETNTLSLKELALSAYSADSGVLESDWYNAVIESMKRAQWNDSAAIGHDFGFDVSRSLMRWYAYELNVDAGTSILNTVTAPIYPSIDAGYDPSIYGYTYLLSPAQSWESFGRLDIVVNTPFYMLDGADGFEKTAAGYQKQLPGLPQGELEFTLSASAAPEAPDRGETLFWGALLFGSMTLAIIIPIVVIILIAVMVVTVIAVRKKKKTRS